MGATRSSINYFDARFSGRCSSCKTAFYQGDQIGYDNEDNIVGLECCGGSNDDDFDSLNRTRSTAIRVMPTGKTAKDKCPRCFIIHTIAQGNRCE